MTIVPCGTVSHFVDPETFATVLFLHSMHEEEFVFAVLSEAFPGGHLLQSDFEEAPVADEYFPATQFVHVVCDNAALALLHFPFPQALQSDIPSISWYLP